MYMYLICAMSLAYMCGWLDAKAPTQFDINHCTRVEMVERCNEVGLTAESTELAIKFFIDKQPIWEVTKDLNIEYDSANTRKKRIKRRLL